MRPRLPPRVGLALLALLAAVAAALGWLLDGPTGALNILAALTAAGLAGYIVWAVPIRLRF